MLISKSIIFSFFTDSGGKSLFLSCEKERYFYRCRLFSSCRFPGGSVWDIGLRYEEKFCLGAESERSFVADDVFFFNLFLWGLYWILRIPYLSQGNVSVAVSDFHCSPQQENVLTNNRPDHL